MGVQTVNLPNSGVQKEEKEIVWMGRRFDRVPGTENAFLAPHFLYQDPNFGLMFTATIRIRAILPGNTALPPNLTKVSLKEMRNGRSTFAEYKVVGEPRRTGDGHFALVFEYTGDFLQPLAKTFHRATTTLKVGNALKSRGSSSKTMFCRTENCTK